MNYRSPKTSPGHTTSALSPAWATCTHPALRSARAKWFDYARTAAGRAAAGHLPAHGRKPHFKPPTEQKSCSSYFFAHAVPWLMPLSSGGCSEMGRFGANGLLSRHPTGCPVRCGFKGGNERKIAPGYGQS